MPSGRPLRRSSVIPLSDADGSQSCLLILQELTAPLLHRVLSHPPLQPLIYGGKVNTLPHGLIARLSVMKWNALA